MIFKYNISSVVNYFPPLSSPFCFGCRNGPTVILTFHVHHIFIVCSSSVRKGTISLCCWGFTSGVFITCHIQADIHGSDFVAFNWISVSRQENETALLSKMSPPKIIRRAFARSYFLAGLRNVPPFVVVDPIFPLPVVPTIIDTV